MKAHFIETYGVHIGWALRAGNGWLLFEPKGTFIEWTWHYTNVRERLENYWTDKAAGQRMPA